MISSKKHSPINKKKYTDYPNWFEYIEKLKNIEIDIKNNFENIDIIYYEIKNMNKIDKFMYNLEESLCKLIESTEAKIRSKDKIFKKLNYKKLEFNTKEQNILTNILAKNNLNNKNIQQSLFKLNKYLNDIIGKYKNDDQEVEVTGNVGNNMAQIQKNTQSQKSQRIKKMYKDTLIISDLIKNLENQIFIQGEYIDRIDNNLNFANNYLKLANDELYDIYRQYNNWAFRAQIFLFICICICCILLLIKWIN